jgi:uncharacterized protein YuzE
VSIHIGDHVFDRARYDEVADVLYLTAGEDQSGAKTYGTPEGHAIRLGESGQIVGLTIVNAGWLAERDREVVVSWPQQQVTISARDVGAAVIGANSR